MVKRNPRRTESLEKALDILEAVTAEPGGETLANLSARVGLDKSTVWRILGTLSDRGYVEHDPVLGRYSLGLGVLTLGAKKQRGLHLVTVARPAIAALVNESQETAQLAVRMGTNVAYLVKEECSQSVQVRSEVGALLPLHATASGKVLLAAMPPSERATLLEYYPLTRFTQNTIVYRQQLERHLSGVLERGYALDDEENEQGVRCVAAPVFASSGRVVAAITVASPAFRLDEGKVELLARQVRDCALQISRNLGFDPGALPVRPGKSTEKREEASG